MKKYEKCDLSNNAVEFKTLNNVCIDEGYKF